MTTFVLKTVDANGVGREFLYNNMASVLRDSLTNDKLLPGVTSEKVTPTKPVMVTWKKSREVSVLKIQLGLSCNYSCEYCLQRFVPFQQDTSAKDVESFMASLEKNVVLHPQARIQFWGGEPLVYWKTMFPLARALRAKYPQAQFSVITNGSLMDFEKALFLMELDFDVAISHDGQGQSIRGADPFDEPLTRQAILMLYQQLQPLGKMSFNAMIHKNNQSRAAVQEFFQKLTGDPDVPIGEGGFIDAYDEGGLMHTTMTPQEHVAFRVQAFDEISNGRALNFVSVGQKIMDFFETLDTGRSGYHVWQKCGMDKEDRIAVTLKGDVVTCQNVSTTSVASNGAPHHVGNIDKMEEVKIESSQHWLTRDNCRSCPVLQLCRGSCMYLQGDLWDASCAASYSDNVVLLAVAIKELTGCTLQSIEPLGNDKLPDYRRKVFEPIPVNTHNYLRKVIPITLEKK